MVTTQPSSRQLAETLGWRDDGRRTQVVEQEIGDLRSARAFFRGEPALFVVTSSATQAGVSDEALLDQAALAGYHAAIDWGLLSTREGVTVFHSRWIRNRDWYRLPRLPWSRIEA